MREELKYLDIEGHYGGDQEWFSYFSMRFGGCAAATACELLLYHALYREGCRALYPYDIGRPTKADFNLLGKRMRPYLKPRAGGISRLSTYTEGLSRYLREETGGKFLLEAESLGGDAPEEEAEAFVREGIRRGIPMPFLLLRHQDPQFSEITWHWFLLTGYEESGEGLRVVYGTYGERYTALLSSLWDTGHEQKGGILRLCIRPAHGETAG